MALVGDWQCARPYVDLEFPARALEPPLILSRINRILPHTVHRG
jgi:hypothetical protein